MDTTTATAFFYTFSTIAQALAGAIALLAAFVLFKLQSMDAEAPHRAQSILEDFAEDHPKHAQLQEHFVHSRWDRFLALLPSEYPLSHTTTAHQRAYNRLRELRQERTALVAALKGAVNKTLATMVGAVGGLALAALAPDGHGGMWWVFLGVSLLGAGGFAVCIASYRPILAALWKQDAQG